MKKFISIALFIIVGMCACNNKESHLPVQAALPAGTINVAILLYPDVELLDFAGPSEVFSNSKGFHVYTVSTGDDKIITKNGTLKINPDYTILNAPQPDIVVVPGASMKTLEPVVNDRQVIEWIRKVNEKTTITMSVCTGAEILSKAGLLDNKSAATHSGATDTLQKLTPKAKFIQDVRFVEDGRLITTAGVSAGIDGALHVVAKLKGMKEALLVTGILEYDKWNPEDGLVIGQQKMMPGMEGMHMKHMEMSKHPASPGAEVLATDSKDPVCGMTLKKGMNSNYNITYNSKSYHFCSGTCKKTFTKHLSVYTSKQ